ncbi:hypothetical protein [Rhodopirellula sp. MGV]|uniref:hypothetical protein n=1 Tax=Rhodopirellula sp. MGV TaxID=2023130 RepID=UPI000B97BE90|nr:hypothetical protein [Rhodopirellula sp. MGV]OYP36844.1 hypothetical protein CGZ80_07290 [Rhodopirellula sp. MGV]PNY36449.1 hypothetical protein C2E31_12690 [Rhodopirellula baltica]
MPEFSDFAHSLRDAMSIEMVSAIESAPMPSLGEGSIHKPMLPLLSGGVGDHLIGVAPGRQMECLSGLWLVAGDIHRSHSISQDLPSREGSFWHGIMHRREGDFGNSKYWFRKVGQHPVLEQIAHQSDGVYTDPYDFVDRCEDAVSGAGDPAEVKACELGQWIEWQALMMWLCS